MSNLGVRPKGKHRVTETGLRRWLADPDKDALEVVWHETDYEWDLRRTDYWLGSGTRAQMEKLRLKLLAFGDFDQAKLDDFIATLASDGVSVT